MKHIDINKITDPFILELIDTFGVTGFKIITKKGEFYVGHPTVPKFETKREMRERWKRFKFLQKRGEKR